MAQIPVQVDLLQKGYPFNVEAFGANVIVNPGTLLQREPYVNRGQDFGDARGLPACYYLQNIMPTVRGYASAHFVQGIPPHQFTGKKIDNFYVLRTGGRQTVLYSPAKGNNIIYNPGQGGWNEFPFGADTEARVTVAYLKGKTYICYENFGLFTYDPASNTFSQEVVAGIDFNFIKGVTAGNNYLVLWGDAQVFWSSGSDPMDFVPSLVTGAGASDVLAARAVITCALQIADGFIVYTTENGIAASYSGNPGSPWIFREIPGSSGVAVPSHVTYESNEETHVSWTAAGFQRVTLRRAEPIWPELTDSIGRGLFSDIDTVTLLPKIIKQSKLDIKVSSVGTRYTAVSVKDFNDANQFLVSYIWDWSTKRWGKLRVPHTDLFDFRLPEFSSLLTYDDFITSGESYADILALGTTYLELALSSADVASTFGENFGVVSEDGTVYQAIGYPDPDHTAETLTHPLYKPMLFFGRFKVRQQSLIYLHELQMNRDVEVAIDCLLHEPNGEVDYTETITDVDSKVQNLYYTRLQADSFSLKLTGKMNLSQLELYTSLAGRRHSRRT